MEEFTERAWRRALCSDTDWRKLLNSFIQEEVFDYSFTPPDRRNCDSEFFLPDFNEKDLKGELDANSMNENIKLMAELQNYDNYLITLKTSLDSCFGQK